jgi:hypothetical protein
VVNCQRCKASVRAHRGETVGPLLVPTGAETATQSIRSFIDGGVTYAGWAPQQDAVLATMRAFMIIAESLSGIPERKALIWASGSFPFYINSSDTSPVHTPAAAQMYERAIPALNQAQISVYPVDVRGLVYYGPTAERNKSGWAAFTNFLTARGQSLSTSIETLQNLAETTGGRAFYNRNDLSAGVQTRRGRLFFVLSARILSRHTQQQGGMAKAEGQCPAARHTSPRPRRFSVDQRHYESRYQARLRFENGPEFAFRCDRHATDPALEDDGHDRRPKRRR